MKFNLFAMTLLAGPAILVAQPAAARTNPHRATCEKLTTAQLNRKVAEFNTTWAPKTLTG